MSCKNYLPRVVAFLPQEAPCVMYTDAMWEPGQPAGLGCVIFSPRRSRPLGLYSQIPDALLREFLPRETQINQAEVAAALLATRFAQDVLRDSFLIHFVDNASALAGLIKGHSQQWDLSSSPSSAHVARRLIRDVGMNGSKAAPTSPKTTRMTLAWQASRTLAPPEIGNAFY